MKDRCDCRPTVRRIDRPCSGRWLAACPHHAAEAVGETSAIMAYCDRERWR